jgi:hypothetical protein
VRPDFDDSSSDDNDLETADVDERRIAPRCRRRG